MSVCIYVCFPLLCREYTVMYLLLMFVYMLVFTHAGMFYSFVDSFRRIYRAPLQETYSESLTVQPRQYKLVLSNL